jgi:hypothetical protein
VTWKRRLVAADDGEIADPLSHAVALFGYANRQAELMMRIVSEFGFTPASRSRISAPPPDQLPLLDLTADDYEQEESERRGKPQKSAALPLLRPISNDNRLG